MDSFSNCQKPTGSQISRSNCDRCKQSLLLKAPSLSTNNNKAKCSYSCVVRGVFGSPATFAPFPFTFVTMNANRMTSTITNRIAPTTMPAIAPPDRPYGTGSLMVVVEAAAIKQRKSIYFTTGGNY